MLPVIEPKLSQTALWTQEPTLRMHVVFSLSCHHGLGSDAIVGAWVVILSCATVSRHVLGGFLRAVVYNTLCHVGCDLSGMACLPAVEAPSPHWCAIRRVVGDVWLVRRWTSVGIGRVLGSCFVSNSTWMGHHRRGSNSRWPLKSPNLRWHTMTVYRHTSSAAYLHVRSGRCTCCCVGRARAYGMG